MKHNNVLLKALALVFVFALAIGCMFSCKTKDAIETLETELDNLEAEVAELAGLASAIDKVEDALESKDAALEEEIAKLAAKLEGVGENELAELVKNAATKAELESALEQVKIAYTAKVDDLAAKVNKLGADLKAEVAALKSAFDDATDKIWDSVDDIATIISVALGCDEDVVFDFANYDIENGDIAGNAYYKTEEAKLVGLYDEYLFRLLRAQSVEQVDALIAQLKDKIAAMPDLLDTYQNMIATKKFTGKADDDAKLFAEVDEIYTLLMGADEDALKAMGYPKYTAAQLTFGLDPLELQKKYFDQAYAKLVAIREVMVTDFAAHNAAILANQTFIWDIFNIETDDETGKVTATAKDDADVMAWQYINNLRQALVDWQNAYLDSTTDAFEDANDYTTLNDYNRKIKNDNENGANADLVVFEKISKFWDLSSQTDKNSFTFISGKNYDKAYKLAINVLNTLDTVWDDEAEKDVYVSYYSELVYEENYYDNLKVAYNNFVDDMNKTNSSYQVLKYVLNWAFDNGSAPLFTQLKDLKANLSNIDGWMKNIAPVADKDGAYDHASVEYQNLAFCLGLNDYDEGEWRYEALLAAVDYAQKMTMIFNNETHTFLAAGENGEDVVVELGMVNFETVEGDKGMYTIKQIADIVASYKDTKLENIYVLDEDLLKYVAAVVSVEGHVDAIAEKLIGEAYNSNKDHNVQVMLGESKYEHFVLIQDRFGELRDAYNKIQAIVATMASKKGNVTFYDESNIIDEKTNWKVQIETILENFEIEDAKNVAALTTDAYKLFDELVLEFNTLIDNFDAIVARAIELLDKIDTWAITLAKEIYGIQANLEGADYLDLEIKASVIGDYENISNLTDAFNNVVNAFEKRLDDAEADADAILNGGDFAFADEDVDIAGIDAIVEKFTAEDYEYILSDFLAIKDVYDAINVWADRYLEADADIAAALDAIAAFYVSADEDEADALEIKNAEDITVVTIAFNSADYKAFMDVYTAFNAKYEAAAATWNALKDQMLALIETKSVHNLKDFQATLKALNEYFNAEFGILDTTPDDKKGIVVGTIGAVTPYEVVMTDEFEKMVSVFSWIMVDEETETELEVTDKLLIKAFLDKTSATMRNIDEAKAAVAAINEAYKALMNKSLKAIDSADFNGEDIFEEALQLKFAIDAYFEMCDCGDAKTCVTKAQMLDVNKVLYKSLYYTYAEKVYAEVSDLKITLPEGSTETLTDEQKATNAKVDAAQKAIKAAIKYHDNWMVNGGLTTVPGIYDAAIAAIDLAIEDDIFNHIDFQAMLALAEAMINGEPV